MQVNSKQKSIFCNKCDMIENSLNAAATELNAF